MLSVHRDLRQPYSLPSQPPITNHPGPSFTVSPRMGGGHRLNPDGTTAQGGGGQAADSTTIAQALEIARESPDGARDPVVKGILETALAQIWRKVQAQPESYIMTRDEFAVFNYFQQRFVGNKMAIAARRRYWDNSQP